jgi:hypothetical protein
VLCCVVLCCVVLCCVVCVMRLLCYMYCTVPTRMTHSSCLPWTCTNCTLGILLLYVSFESNPSIHPQIMGHTLHQLYRTHTAWTYHFLIRYVHQRNHQHNIYSFGWWLVVDSHPSASASSCVRQEEREFSCIIVSLAPCRAVREEEDVVVVVFFVFFK